MRTCTCTCMHAAPARIRNHARVRAFARPGARIPACGRMSGHAHAHPHPHAHALAHTAHSRTHAQHSQQTPMRFLWCVLATERSPVFIRRQSLYYELLHVAPESGPSGRRRDGQPGMRMRMRMRMLRSEGSLQGGSSEIIRDGQSKIDAFRSFRSFGRNPSPKAGTRYFHFPYFSYGGGCGGRQPPAPFPMFLSLSSTSK